VTLRKRHLATSTLRRFFDQQDFIEVATPVALRAPAPEPTIEAPSVQLQGRTLFLQPSPELPMKKLMAEGADRIYQIACVFRDEPAGPLHQPQFRMLEWYRRDAGLQALLQDCTSLLLALMEACGTPELRRGGMAYGGGEIPRVSVDEAFRASIGFSILDALDAPTLARHLDHARVRRAPDDDWNDLFHRAILTHVEPWLCQSFGTFFLTHYPAPLSALARLDPSDPRVALRMELYVCGVELANGFDELTDPTLQRQRFELDRALRRARGMNDYPLDEEFLAALPRIGRAAGCALGFDRLLMLLLGEPALRDETSAL
jgi:lysyl-tRNA synthetase class 2